MEHGDDRWFQMTDSLYHYVHVVLRPSNNQQVVDTGPPAEGSIHFRVEGREMTTLVVSDYLKANFDICYGKMKNVYKSA